MELQARFNRLLDRSPASTRESSPILPRTRSAVATAADNAAMRRAEHNTAATLRPPASPNTTTHSVVPSIESENPASISRGSIGSSSSTDRSSVSRGHTPALARAPATASSLSTPRVTNPIASTSGLQSHANAVDISIDSDFSDMEDFLLNIGDIATPAPVMEKPQRFIYGPKTESFIDTCRNEKISNPFTKHIAQFGHKDRRTNVCFTAKVIQRTSIIDTQNGAGENFSFAMVNVLDSDARVEDRTCVMRGTAIAPKN